MALSGVAGPEMHVGNLPETLGERLQWMLDPRRAGVGEGHTGLAGNH